MYDDRDDRKIDRYIDMVINKQVGIYIWSRQQRSGTKERQTESQDQYGRLPLAREALNPA